MEHVLSVTIQGSMGFSTGYVWWMGAEELVFWCSEHLPRGEEVRLRIDWAMGTALIDCTAMIHGVLPISLTRVNKGRAFYCTYDLVKIEDLELLRKGLFQANPVLKAHGLDYIPFNLATARKKAENRLGRQLGKDGAVTDPALPSGHGVGGPARGQAVRKPGRLPPSRMLARLASTLKPDFPGDSTAGSVEFVGVPTTGDVRARRRSAETLDEFSRDDVSDSLEFAGLPTGRGGSSLQHKTGANTARLRLMARQLRERAASPEPASPGKPPARVKTPTPELEVVRDATLGFLRIAEFVHGPPHSALLRINDPAQLRRSVDIVDDQIVINLLKEQEMSLWDKVTILMVLHDGTFLELEGKVIDLPTQCMCLSVTRPSQVALETLRHLLVRG